MAKYKLKNDGIVINSVIGKITSVNLTDEKVKALLKINPDHIKFFELIDNTPLEIKEEPKKKINKRTLKNKSDE